MKMHKIIFILIVIIISSCKNEFIVEDKSGQESKVTLYKWKNKFSESIHSDKDLIFTGHWKGELRDQDTITTDAQEVNGNPLSNFRKKYYIFEDGQLNPIYPNYSLF